MSRLIINTYLTLIQKALKAQQAQSKEHNTNIQI